VHELVSISSVASSITLGIVHAHASYGIFSTIVAPVPRNRKSETHMRRKLLKRIDETKVCLGLFQAGYTHYGTADFIGAYRGVPIAIELKSGMKALTTKYPPHQEEWANNWVVTGRGLYVLSNAYWFATTTQFIGMLDSMVDPIIGAQ